MAACGLGKILNVFKEENMPEDDFRIQNQVAISEEN